MRVRNVHLNKELVKNNRDTQNNVKNKHQTGSDSQLVFSFSKFKLQPITINHKFNNHYKGVEQYVEKITLLLGKALPLLSQERETLFTSESIKANAIHLHKVIDKREIVVEILKNYGFTNDEIDNIFEGEEIYQLEVPYVNGATRIFFQRIDNTISFLFMDPNHHVYFNESMEEAQRALFFEYCPVNKAKQCERMDYFHTCFAFEFLDETKYNATWSYSYDPQKELGD